MTYYGRWTYKFEEAARRGAIAALVVHETAGAGYGWNTVQAPGGENYNIVLKPGAPQPVLLQGWIQRARPRTVPPRRARFRDGEAAGADRRLSARSTSARFSADFGVEAVRVESHNVLGKIAGSKHPDETIWFAGHWDAYGVGAPDARGQEGPPRRARRRVGDRRRGRARPRLQGRAAAGADPGLRRLDGRGAGAARRRALCDQPALPDGQSGRQPDPRHAPAQRPRPRRRADRQGPERPRGPARRGRGAAGADGHARRPARARPVLPRRPFRLRQAGRAGAAADGAGRRSRPGRRAGARRATAGSPSSPPIATTRPATNGGPSSTSSGAAQDVALFYDIGRGARLRRATGRNGISGSEFRAIRERTAPARR